MSSSSPKLAAVAALLALPVAAALAAELPARTMLPDGLELVVLPDPAARTASLRCVVRVGSVHDPAGKEGLAHLLEHLVLRARGRDGLDVVEAARAAGAHLNAYTSRDSTTYVLDAPAEPFPALADRLLRAVTTLRPNAAELAREISVIQREAEYRGDGTVGLVEDALFRTRAAVGTILGDAASRDRITLEDLLGFYQAAYVSPATTIVFAGAVTVADASALLRRAWLLPPVPSQRPRQARQADPELPVDERIRAPFLAAVHGYRIDAADRDLCRPLAALLEQRFLAAIARRPLVRNVEVACVTVREVDLLLAFAYAPTLDATDLPSVMEEVFGEAVTRPPRRDERRHVELRMSRLDDAVQDDPAALASEVARVAARPRDAGPTPLPNGSARPIPVERMQAMARRAFVPARRVVVFMSPFEG